MGCTSFTSISETENLQQETIELDLTNEIKGLSHAKSLINLITRLRNKIIYLYHKLIYDSGACVFLHPNIVHCLNCIFFKVSSEFEGNLKNSGITFKEDPPYLNLSNEIRISDESNNLFQELFNFINELVSYKTIMKQIDKETPELLYLVYETKNKLSNKNIELINKGIELFKNTKQLKYEILNSFKNQIYEFAYRRETFNRKIDLIGREAFEKNITDIYEIAMLQKNHIPDDNDNDIDNNNDNDSNKISYKMFKSVYNAKVYMKNIINNERNDDIIDSHESIIENINVSNYDENK